MIIVVKLNQEFFSSFFSIDLDMFVRLRAHIIKPIIISTYITAVNTDGVLATYQFVKLSADTILFEPHGNPVKY